MKVANLFHRAVPDMVRQQTFGEVYRTIAQYYAAMRRNPQLFTAFQKKSAAGATILRDFLPFVEEVYGTGYPHYGNVNPLKRFSFQAKGLDDLAPENLWTVLARLIPDMDYLVVFNDGGKKYSLHPEMHKMFAVELRRLLESYPLDWESAQRKLDELNIADISPDQVAEFISKGAIHLDLLAVPAHVFQEADCFIDWEIDIPNLAFVRDIGFTCKPLVTGNFADLPTRHRINRLLLVLSNTGQTTVKALLTATIASHPYVPIAYLFQEAMNNMVALWYPDLMQAQSSNLISIGHNERVCITDAGRDRLNQVLTRRRSLYINGFVSDQ